MNKNSASRFLTKRRPIHHLSLALSMALLWLTPYLALGTTRTVTSSADTGPGTLRDIIAASVNGDTIDFAAGINTITLTSGELLIGRSITINGPGASLLTVTRSGTTNFRIFKVSNGTTTGPTAILAGLTISNGIPPGTDDRGAGIFNDHGTLAVNNCTLRDNNSNGSIGVDGGCINNNQGALTLSNCTVSGNSSQNGTGGIVNFDGTLTLTNCTLSGNSSNAGGGIYSVSQGSGFPVNLRLINCTISGNSASRRGGGISSYANSGGSVAVTILNTIIASNGNSATIGPDVDMDVGSTLTSQGHNLIGKTDGSSGWVASDLTGNSSSPLDPLLDPLTDNGGPTQTMALQPTSAAVDAGDDSVLGSPLNLTTDQRGPGFPRKLGAHVDIGAFEADAPQGGPTFTVTTNADHDDGMCGVVDCTLREAINAANAAFGPNTIVFAPGVTGTITLLLGSLNITDSTTIIGPGARLLAVSGNAANTVFSLSAGTSTISGLTISDGLMNPPLVLGIVPGGGIFNQGMLTLIDCILSGNQDIGRDNTSAGGSGGTGAGGAIGNTGVLTLNRCTFSGNAAAGGHGGADPAVPHTGGTGGAGQGGAVFNKPGATLTINNCTFFNNTGTGGAGADGGGHGGNGGNGTGGAVFNLGTMTVTAVTVSGNTGSGGAGGKGSSKPNNGVAGLGNGGLADGGGTSTVGDTISAGNSGNNGGGLDVAGTFTSNGYNFIGSGDHSNGFTNGANHDQVGTDTARINPQLGPLQNNGGPTDTMALLSASPAINKGDPNAPPQDQRYYLRSGVTDIGAFEFGGTLAPISAVSRKMHGTLGPFDIPLPLAGPRGVECRTGGVTQVVFTFPTAVTINTTAGTQGAMVTSGTGSVTSTSGSSTVATPVVTVNLTGVTNIQYITLTLFGVNDGINTNNVALQMGVLIGDVNFNGVVTNADVSLVKAQVAAGGNVDSSNFRDDVNANGVITNADVSLTKAQVAAGAQLPTPP